MHIPSIAFGREQSRPQVVEVVAGAPADQTAGADIILEVEVDTAAPYVQQQVIYTVRLFHRVELSSPRFSALDTSAEAIIKPLGDGRQYMHTINGTNYEAFESRYAIFPQQSGAVTLRPLVLTTQVITRNQRSFFDPFSQALQTRRVESDAIELDVRPIPPAFPAGATWLPAKRIRLHDAWEPDVTTAEVGSPLSRTVFLWAEGLIARHLPEIRITPPTGTKIYPDQAQSDDQESAAGFTAVMQQKFALIAGTAGSGRFEPITLPWWNIETDALEVATIPARAFEFRGNQLPANNAAPAPTRESDSRRPAEIAAAGSIGPTGSIVSALLALGWLATVLLWVRSNRLKRPTSTPAVRPLGDTGDKPRGAQAVRDLKVACGRNDAVAAARALRAWARSSKRPRAAEVSSLRDVAAIASNSELQTQIVALERALYGRAVAAWTGSALWDAFRLEPRAAPSDASIQSEPLPALFRLATK